MKILFIAPQIGAGNGGVADYVQRLGLGLAGLGHHVMACGLRQAQAAPPSRSAAVAGAGSLVTVGLAGSLGWTAAAKALRKHCGEFGPDLVSLQFVNYGFGPRGLIHGMAAAIPPVLAGRPVHVFFHELWQGHATGAPLRERILGWVQRRQILWMARRLGAFRCTTSNRYYQQVLARSGIGADVLPVFGNVPVSGKDGRGWLCARLGREAGVEADLLQKRALIFGLFGSIHPWWPAERVVPELAQCARELGRRPLLVLMGRNGDAAPLMECVERLGGPEFGAVSMGELPEEELDLAIAGVDAGLATTPVEGLGKSGAAGAMLDHGKPLLALAGSLAGGPEAPWPDDPHVWPVDGNLARRFASVAALPARGPSLPSVVDYYAALARLVGAAPFPPREQGFPSGQGC